MSDNNPPTVKEATAPLRAMDVLRFLRQHPGFFSQYPDLLAQLQVVDDSGAVTNLVNYQVKVLQEKNQQLGEQLQALMAAARSSEKLLDKVFELALKFSTLGPDQSSLNAFMDYVREAFPSDFLALAVVPERVPPDTRMQHVKLVSDGDEFATLFRDVIEQSEPLCGRIKADKREYLFGKDASEVASVALMPLGESARSGLLAFGSRDERRFEPGMSTDILQKLAQLLHHKLQHDQQQAAGQPEHVPVNG
jgi:uncharacterized protein YigA (DUF484 family)